MQVRIRHEEQREGLACGDMNPEQLHHFVNDLKDRGILDAQYEEHACEVVLQYVDTGEEFFAEILWNA